MEGFGASRLIQERALFREVGGGGGGSYDEDERCLGDTERATMGPVFGGTPVGCVNLLGVIRPHKKHNLRPQPDPRRPVLRIACDVIDMFTPPSGRQRRLGAAISKKAEGHR